MTSYQEIADAVLIMLGQPKNYELRQTLIKEAKEVRALLLRQDAERNGHNDGYSQRVVIELQQVNQADTCVYDSDDCALRTVNLVPEPVRIKDGVPFSFVGTGVGKHHFVHTPLEVLNLHNTKNIPVVLVNMII